MSEVASGGAHTITLTGDQRAAGGDEPEYGGRRSPGLDLTSEWKHRAASQLAWNPVHGSCDRAGGRHRGAGCR